jgi:hypothetical protein
MLTMVSAQNARGDTLLLPLFDDSAGYVVREIQGLSPVKAVLTSSSQAQMDGAQPQNSRRDVRNITMKVGLKPDYAVTTVADLRSNLYSYFMTKNFITFTIFVDDMPFAITAAEVESCDNDMFSSDPQVDVSLICYDPDFYDLDVSSMSSTTVADTSEQTISYDGTTDTGFIFQMTIPSPVSEIRLYNTRPDNIIQLFTLDGAFQANDVLTINTIQGQKAVTITRAGLPISVLYYLDPRAIWPSLAPGDNQFRAFVNASPIAYTVSWTNKYGGI